jgi:dTDP-4-dehydrorhamnose reductase
MKKIFVIGGSSFVGKNLGKIIQNDLFVKSYFKNRISKGIFFDIEKSSIDDVLFDKNEFSHILLLSGIFKFDEINADPLRARYINVDCLKPIIDEAINIGLTVVFFSSESVFDGIKGNYTEIDTPNPKFEYARQKVEIENYIKERTSNYLILRLSKVFSSDFNDNTLVSRWLKQLKGNESIFCAKDNFFCPIHINDLILIIEKLLINDFKGTYHLSSSKPFSRIEMFDFLFQEYKKFDSYSGKLEIKNLYEIDGTQNYPLNTSLNPSAVIQLTNIYPKNFPFWATFLVKEFFRNK